MRLLAAFQKNKTFIAVIAIAFVVIEIASSLWLMGIMDGKLTKNAAKVLRTAEANIKTTLSEPGSTIVGAVESIRYLIETGDDIDKTVEDYLVGMTNWFDENEERLGGFNGLYGLINGRYVDGAGWVPPPGYDPVKRAWYASAMSRPGKVTLTPPYVDMQTGDVIVSFSMEIKGSDGITSYGVIALDVLLSKVSEVVNATKVADGGYGVLISSDGTVLSHMNSDYVGVDYGELFPEFKNVRNELNNNRDSSSLRITNFEGERCVGHYIRLYNGWYLGVITPLGVYFKETYRMIATTVVALTLTAAAVCFAMLRIGVKREKQTAAERKVIQRNFYILSAVLLALVMIGQIIPFYVRQSYGAREITVIRDDLAAYDNKVMLNQIDALSNAVKTYLKDYEDAVDAFMFHAAMAFQLYDLYAEPTVEQSREFAKRTRVTEFEVFKRDGNIIYATGDESIKEDSFNLITEVWDGYQGIVDGTTEEIPTTIKVRQETGEIFKFTAVPRLDKEGNITGIIESCLAIEDLQPNVERFLNNYVQILSFHMFAMEEDGLCLVSVEKENASVKYERGKPADVGGMAAWFGESGSYYETKDGTLTYYAPVDRQGVGSAYIVLLELDESYYTDTTDVVNANVDDIYSRYTAQSVTAIVICFASIIFVIIAYVVNLNSVILKYFTALQEQTQIAESANEAKSSFLATMSHEIRTPMNAIIGVSEIELMREDLSKREREALGKIHSSGCGLLGIINDILDLSKIETGKLELSPAEYDTPSMINDAVQLNVVRIGSKPIEFALSVDENFPSRLIGDELRIKQVLNNLLSNAFKYTDKGTVKLSISTASRLTDREGDERGGDETTIVFMVSDTGQGMKPADLAQLFSEYSRFNQDANRKTEGTGLGMSITRKLVEMMGGKIDVQSEYGKGSVFTVTLKQTLVPNADPVGIELAERLSKFTFTDRSGADKLQFTREYMPYGTALIVDDVETNLYVAQGLMAPYGLDVETALSGFEALDKVKAGEVYDIIFLDHMMPEMDGIETARKIRAMGYDEPIIALTANAITGADKMFKAEGFNDFISKPIDIRQLNNLLNTYVRNRHKAEAERFKGQTAAAEQPSAVVLPDKLAEVFCRDAAKASATMTAAADSGDFLMYETTAHAMKSACANVGNQVLSDFAKKLEDAGKRGDADYIKKKTAEFVTALTAFAESVAPKETEDESVVDEDTTLLSAKMAIVSAACGEYDERAAGAVMAELEKMKWSGATKRKLADISDKLLHSDFEEAAAVADSFIIKND